uniref:Ribosomal protein S19 n=1 Tax=Leucosceptrum canum TaxID=694369 RepID=A0A7G7YCJ9_LEUCN|nr:ribosomal protein S19 [Leucosceptrum canum]QNH92219.1 ribosomal protein S19 [Leucosceptrum canum]
MFFKIRLTAGSIITFCVSLEIQSRYKFSQFVTYHTICYINRQMLLTIMNSNRMADHCGYNGRCTGPSYDYFFFCFFIKLIDFS